jgi:hypothetical protein
MFAISGRELEMMNVELFQSLLFLDAQLSVFRYDRWDKILFISLNIKECDHWKRSFIALLGCSSLQFHTDFFNTKNLCMRQSNKTFILENSSQTLSIKFDRMELWTEEKFNEYDAKSYIELGIEGRYGFRRSINNFEEI